MRKRLLPVACAVVAVASLSSCASVPVPVPPIPFAAAPRQVLTFELYDSSSEATISAAQSFAATPLPMPEIQGELLRSATGQTPSAQPSDAGSDAGPVISLTEPSRPRQASGFPLAQPVAPIVVSAPIPAARPAQGASAGKPAAQSSNSQSVAPQASTTAQAPVPAQQKTASQASAPQPATQQRGVTPQPATQQAAALPSLPGATAASGDTYGRLREIYARAGDELQIGLDGAGFLFLGFPDSQAQSTGMSFKTKETRSGKTWFTFQALKLGTYDLDFLQQDNVSGNSAKETVRVHVVSDQDFGAALSQPPAQDATQSDSADPAFADRLTGLGAYEAAVAELLKGYKDGNAALNDQIARLYMRMGSYDAAGKFYQKNASLTGPFAGAAVLGLVRVAAAQKDQVGLMAQLKRFLAIRDPGAEEPLILAVRMERDAGQVGVGLDLAAEYLSRYPEGQWRDEVAFIAAQFREADSPFRDIARARDLYRQIVADSPVGGFAAAAQERLQYIERHFFQVR